VKTFPVTIKEGNPVYTSKFYIMFGGTDIANTDDKFRACMIKRALDIWQQTPDYHAWYNIHLKNENVKKNTIKFNVRIS
jgi:hypothetical protein